MRRKRISKKEQKHRLNRDIRTDEVRLIGGDGEQLGVVSLRSALDAAAESSLDLVELQPNAEPPVCRLMDYGKFLYQQKKKQVEEKQFFSEKELFCQFIGVSYNLGFDPSFGQIQYVGGPGQNRNR